MTRDTSLTAAWSGRIDASDGIMGRRWHQVVRPAAAADRAGVALVGFACDAGVVRNSGRPGAAAGPVALRRALANLAWHGGDDARLYDAGDVSCRGDDLEAAQSSYAERLAALLRAGHFPIGLGGGHEIAFGAYLGLEQSFGNDPRLERLGIVNFDAHLDLRTPEAAGRGTSGTPFLQIAQAQAARGHSFRYLCVGASDAANTPALFERARDYGVEVISDLAACTTDAEQQLRRFIGDSTAVYLTFCLDVLPAAVAPGVSAPAGLGVPLHRAVELLRSAIDACGHGRPGGKLLLADVAELNPQHDPDGRTARTAARLAYELTAIRR